MTFRKAISVVACLMGAPGAFASSLENMDTVDYRITVMTDEATSTMVIAAGSKIENICDNCTLQLSGQEDTLFRVYVDEVVAIKNGRFFLPDEE